MNLFMLLVHCIVSVSGGLYGSNGGGKGVDVARLCALFCG